ncbi:response regulator [Azospirillum sp. SYSU D00513]|uniref:response regulator n=1 Tax=Azospirillum sp. SYSU D00513 TaxID=2812561 RepID=UPI001A968F24|nr:response regulator [Azospirillum sp. SYSU D00513]
MSSVPSPSGAPVAHVLVAEDIRINRELVVYLLTLGGYAVSAVENGEQAVEAVRRGGVDLVLMDLHMPVMDGLAATRAIRALPGPESGTPIIGLSAGTHPSETAAQREAGMDGLVTKPVDRATLMDSVAGLIAERRKAYE